VATSDETLRTAIEELTDAVHKMAGTEVSEGDQKKKDNKKFLKELGGNTNTLLSNTAGLIGLSSSMLTLKGMLGDVRGMNSQVSKSLGQTSAALDGHRSATDRFAGASVGMQQALNTFAEAVDLGISDFSDNALRLGAQMKVLGLDSKTGMKLMRFNTQALGASSESSVTLVDTLVSTAAANKDSISGLIGAIESMKTELTKTSVELGPNAAANAQKIAAMMSQGNSELQGAASEFVTSFLAGTEGFARAAKLGVVFTGQESLEEMVVKFEQILTKVGSYDPGGGAGQQYTLEALEKGGLVSRQNIFLQRQIGNEIRELKATNTEQLAQDVGKISIDQAYQNATFATQQLALTAAEGAAAAINTIAELLGPWGTAILGLLGTISASLLGPLWFSLKLGFNVMKGSFNSWVDSFKSLSSGFKSFFSKSKTFWSRGGKNLDKIAKGASGAAKGGSKAGWLATLKKGSGGFLKGAFALTKGLLKKVPIVAAGAALYSGGMALARGEGIKAAALAAADSATFGLASAAVNKLSGKDKRDEAVEAAADGVKENGASDDKTDTQRDQLESKYRDDVQAYEEAKLDLQKKQLEAQQQTAAATTSMDTLNKEAKEGVTSRGPDRMFANRMADQIFGMNKLVDLAVQANADRITVSENQIAAGEVVLETTTPGINNIGQPKG